MTVTVSPSSKASRLAKRLKQGCRRLYVQESGTAAIEFATVALPFLLLLVSIFEVGMVMFTQTELQGATQEAARQILAAARNRVNTRYVPLRWGLVGLVLRLIPSCLFRHLNF